MVLKCQGAGWNWTVSDTTALYWFVPCEAWGMGGLYSLKSTFRGQIFYTKKYMHIDFSAHNIFQAFIFGNFSKMFGVQWNVWGNHISQAKYF